MDPYLGEIRIFAGTFAPTGWLLCNGALLPLSRYTALYSLLGTQYGGDGRTTFALPDLRGRIPVSFGQGAGLQQYVQGEMTGTESESLTLQNIGLHNHNVNVIGAPGDQLTPAGNRPGQYAGGHGGGIKAYGPSTGTKVAMATQAIGSSPGTSLPHPNQQPSLALTFIIATSGIFPTRP